MALSDSLSKLYDQVNSMLFIADSIQKCLADPMCYPPANGTGTKEKVLQFQSQINSAIMELRDKIDQSYNTMDQVSASSPDLVESAASSNPDDYLVVEDKKMPTTWHLQVKKNGEYDRGLCGAAWAALHKGFRGNKYQGPKKQEAIKKLKAIYKKMDWPLPSE